MAESGNGIEIIGGLTDPTAKIANEIVGGVAEITTTPNTSPSNRGSAEVVGGLTDPGAAVEAAIPTPSREGEPQGDWKDIAPLDMPIPTLFDMGGLMTFLEEAGTKARRVGGAKEGTELGERYMALGEKWIGLAVGLREGKLNMAAVLSQLNPPPVNET